MYDVRSVLIASSEDNVGVFREEVTGGCRGWTRCPNCSMHVVPQPTPVWSKWATQRCDFSLQTSTLFWSTKPSSSLSQPVLLLHSQILISLPEFNTIKHIHTTHWCEGYWWFYWYIICIINTLLSLHFLSRLGLLVLDLYAAFTSLCYILQTQTWSWGETLFQHLSTKVYWIILLKKISVAGLNTCPWGWLMPCRFQHAVEKSLEGFMKCLIMKLSNSSSFSFWQIIS